MVTQVGVRVRGVSIRAARQAALGTPGAVAAVLVHHESLVPGFPVGLYSVRQFWQGLQGLLNDSVSVHEFLQ